MKHRWAALLSVLAFSALVSEKVYGQTGGTPPVSQRIAGSLGQNQPNPFNPETTIPFSIGLTGEPPVCTAPSVQHRVSLRIYDLLLRVIAIPILQGGGNTAGRPVDKVLLGCGEYSAYWDGLRMGTTQKVPSGPLIYILEVDGKTIVKRMFVAK